MENVANADTHHQAVVDAGAVVVVHKEQGWSEGLHSDFPEQPHQDRLHVLVAISV